MTDHVEDLKAVHNILWAARMDAACDRWHLDERALPRLKALAGGIGEPRLHHAVEETTRASEHFVAARDALRGATRLVEACIPAPVSEDDPSSDEPNSTNQDL
jgi:hypothetical protein